MSFDHRIIDGDDDRLNEVDVVESLDNLDELAGQLRDDALYLHKRFPVDEKQLGQFAEQFAECNKDAAAKKMRQHVDGRMQECLVRIASDSAAEKRAQRFRTMRFLAGVAVCVVVLVSSAGYLHQKFGQPDTPLRTQDVDAAKSAEGITTIAPLLATDPMSGDESIQFTSQFSDEDADFHFDASLGLDSPEINALSNSSHGSGAFMDGAVRPTDTSPEAVADTNNLKGGFVVPMLAPDETDDSAIASSETAKGGRTDDSAPAAPWDAILPVRASGRISPVRDAVQGGVPWRSQSDLKKELETFQIEKDGSITIGF